MQKSGLWMFAFAVFSYGMNAVHADEVTAEAAEPVEQVAFWESETNDSWMPSFSTTPTLSAEVELLLFQLNSGLGTFGNDVVGPGPGYRLAVSGMNAEGLGLRATYMDFSESGIDPVFGPLLFGAYNLDLEVFKRFDLNDRTMIELTGGIRNNHTQFVTGIGPTTYNGIGISVGAQAGFQTTENGLLYTRAKWASMSGNGTTFGLPLKDQLRSQTELAIGYQHQLTYGNVQITPRVGYEFQTWNDFGIPAIAPTLGLSGLVLGLGFAY